MKIKVICDNGEQEQTLIEIGEGSRKAIRAVESQKGQSMKNLNIKQCDVDWLETIGYNVNVPFPHHNPKLLADKVREHFQIESGMYAITVEGKPMGVLGV